MKALVLALLLPGASLADDKTGVDVKFGKSAGATVLERVEKFSAAMLGLPYYLGPLGEGENGEYDSDPLVDFTRADCTTFVEQALALARASDQASFDSELAKIRYKDGTVSYETRNHFADADWLPNNISAGVLKDVTTDVAGKDVESVTRVISKKAMYAGMTVENLEGEKLKKLSPQEKKDRVAKWRQLGDNYADEKVTISYLPTGKILKHAASIKSGTVVNLVQDAEEKYITLIFHQGLFIRKDGKEYFRNAVYDEKVKDVPLEKLVKKFKSGRMIGINLAEPLEP
jgi:hypothetical protein